MYENDHNPLAWIRGLETGNVTIEDDVWIGPFCVIDGQYDKLFIGRGVNVSSGCQITTHDTVKRCVTGRRYSNIDHAPIRIEEYVYIGSNAVVLKGAIIGHHSVIAAGAVVMENAVIPPYSLVAGVPGVVKKNISESVKSWSDDEDPIQ
ncbi:MAG: acyltransferase [Chloracidobacterium sp.]|nr:acyltransferase [Chloracidobacterium sp.]MCC6824995.1 acyltransferase [Acidobacteriota bacterium]MCO5333365.1 acyltransferase [Pyrinomonadaceae bacterium]